MNQRKEAGLYSQNHPWKPTIEGTGSYYEKVTQLPCREQVVKYKRGSHKMVSAAVRAKDMWLVLAPGHWEETRER